MNTANIHAETSTSILFDRWYRCAIYWNGRQFFLCVRFDLKQIVPFYPISSSLSLDINLNAWKSVADIRSADEKKTKTTPIRLQFRAGDAFDLVAFHNSDNAIIMNNYSIVLLQAAIMFSHPVQTQQYTHYTIFSFVSLYLSFSMRKINDKTG